MTIKERQDYAATLKREMNCCQAVVRAFADTIPLDETTLMSLSAGFGAGMGTMEGTCGALVGAIIVAGLRTGGNGTVALSRKILPRFKELCGGATICRDLKGIETGKVLCSCENCVRNAVCAAEEAFAEN
jgi:C_GCAxxG_C_C family probable redox protein